MRVVILGSGNVASVFSEKLLTAGHQVVQVFSRNIKHAATLANRVNASFTNEVSQVLADADVYIIAVSDNAVAELSVQLPSTGGLVVHTAGSVPLAAVSKHKVSGVLYPLQSLRQGREMVTGLPLLVDGNGVEALKLITTFAGSFGSVVHIAGDEERLKLHVAAVVLNNFFNHLLTLGENFCKKEGLNFGLLIPLVEETASRVKQFSPMEMQTGPAIRNDRATIEKHLAILADYKDLSEIYSMFSQKIQSYYTR